MTAKLIRSERALTKKAGHLSGENFWKNGPLWLAFLLPVFIMVVIFMIRGVYPFGDRTFLRTDLYNQYAPFFSELWRKLRNGDSLAYSWNIGMGSNFWALYAYYLASPFNFLVMFVPQTHIIEFMTALIVIKIGLSGFTFAWYLNRHFGEKEGHPSYGVTCFGVLYALSGYMAAYSWNIMWLDCLILIPLIIWGLELLVKEGRCAIYCICLGLSILSNYYLSIMICIFVVIYFIMLIVNSSPEDQMAGKKLALTFGRFALYSLLAGGFAGAILLPEFHALQMTKFSEVSWPSAMKAYFSTIDVLSRHFINVDVEIGLDHWPNLYCGVGILFLFPLYIMNDEISWKEKTIKLSVAVVMLISYSNNILDMIWHGFHFPDSLPARQSFLYIFLLLTMGYEALYRIRSNSNREVAVSFWGAIAVVILCEKLVTEDFINYDSFLLTGLFLVLYAWMCYLYRKKPQWKRFVVIVTVGIVALEAAVNMEDTSVATTSRNSYLSDWNGTEKLLADLEKEDTDFYRMEKVSRRTKNDGNWLGYHGASLFSSTNNSYVANFYKEVGMLGSKNSYAFSGATPLMSAILSVKYTLSDEELEEPLRTLVAQQGDVYLYKNKYVLPLGFMLPETMEEQWDYDAGSPISCQNRLAAELIGADYDDNRLLNAMDCEVTANTAGFTVEQDGYYYFYMGDTSAEDITVSIQENNTDGVDLSREHKYSQTNREYLIETGYVKAGSHVTVTAEEVESITPTLYRLDEEVLEKAFQALDEQPMTVENYDSTHINAHIDVKRAGKLVLSVPEEDGWTVWVDGVETEATYFADAFICLDLSRGEHSISLSYRPYGIYTGTWITLCSLLAFLAIMCYKHRDRLTGLTGRKKK